jgi:hypothetical protein
VTGQERVQLREKDRSVDVIWPRPLVGKPRDPRLPCRARQPARPMLGIRARVAAPVATTMASSVRCSPSMVCSS